MNKFYLNVFNMGESFIDLIVENLLVLVVVSLCLTVTRRHFVGSCRKCSRFGDMWWRKYAEYIYRPSKSPKNVEKQPLTFSPQHVRTGILVVSLLAVSQHRNLYTL